MLVNYLIATSIDPKPAVTLESSEVVTVPADRQLDLGVSSNNFIAISHDCANEPAVSDDNFVCVSHDR